MNESSKKFRKKLALLGTVAVLGVSGAAVANNTINKDVNTTKEYTDNSKSDFLENNSQYYSKEDLYPAYCYIKDNLKYSSNLDNNEIIEISNIYKKLVTSIDYINESLTGTEIYNVLDDIPDTDGIFTDMKDDLTNLIVDNSLLVMPDNIDDESKILITESYLLNTDEIPFDNVKISYITDKDEYYIVSKDNKFFFNMNISQNENTLMYISKDNQLKKHIDKVSENSISITEKDKDIPNLNLNNLKNKEEAER